MVFLGFQALPINFFYTNTQNNKPPLYLPSKNPLFSWFLKNTIIYHQFLRFLLYFLKKITQSRSNKKIGGYATILFLYVYTIIYTLYYTIYYTLLYYILFYYTFVIYTYTIYVCLYYYTVYYLSLLILSISSFW